MLKADGLAAGKGVVIAETYEEARHALDEMFDGKFGSAGSEVVIEQFLMGEEASFFALTDGTAIVPIGTAITSAWAQAIPDRTPAAWAPIPPLRY